MAAPEDQQTQNEETELPEAEEQNPQGEPEEGEQGEDEAPKVEKGQTVLLLPNVSKDALLQEALREPYNQLAVLSAIALDQGVNIVYPHFIMTDIWNTGHADHVADEIIALVEKVDHVFCVNFWANGVRLMCLKIADRLGKPITFLDWDAANGGFLVADSSIFSDNEDAVAAKDNETSFAFRYLSANEPAMDEVILGLPMPETEDEEEEEEEEESINETS